MRRARIGLILVALTVGLAAGIGAYTFVYARGASYFMNDPAACVNCHIVREQYDGWIASSHRAVAGCNDCHTPHALVPKYATKALNGFWHSFYFTTGSFHAPIRINARNRAVTEGACRHCHAVIVHAIDAAPKAGGALACIHCHNSVGHLH